MRGGGREYFHICSGLPEPKLAIYSGFIDWGATFYKNSILISHGITWDVPVANADSSTLIRILNRFSMLISVDMNTISWFRSTFSYDLSKSEVLFKYIPNYVDTDIFTPGGQISNESVKITFPRRLCRERGFWLFAPVAKRLLEKYQYVLIEFVGFVHDEDIALYLEELKTAYGDRVSHRVIPADQMHEVYRDTDVSVIPTLYAEGTSLSCLEAMASGNCVVSTNIGGLANLVLPDFNGKLINPDAGELFEALCNVIENSSERKRLQENAVNVALAFSKDIWVKRWDEVFNEYLT